jgi:spore germination cell wall hydrolase CwlJ-like protein
LFVKQGAGPAVPAKAQPASIEPRDTIASLLVGEAGGEKNPITAMRAVGDVLNTRAARMPGKNWEGSVLGAALKPKQFSVFNGGVLPVYASATNHPQYWPAQQLADRLLANDWSNDTVGKADHYFNPKKANPSWARGRTPVTNINNHAFYDLAKKTKR